MLKIKLSKSLPYMGRSLCCITFEMLSERVTYNATVKYPSHFIGKILNSTVLEGEDYITFFEGDFYRDLKLIVIEA